MPCYHIIERYPSMRSGPAVKRCYGSRKSAEITRRRGVTGDRADYQLDPGRALGVVACYDSQQCDCAKWPQGHNAAVIPVKPGRNLIMCERCNSGRRNAVELIDPKTEEPMLLCERCAKNVALGRLFKRREARHVHADDAALSMIVINQ